MRQVPLRKIKENMDGVAGGLDFDYAQTMLVILRAGGVQGITIDEMSRRMSTIDKLMAAVKEDSGCILLEDTEHSTLLAIIKRHPFRRVVRSAVQMQNEVEHAVTVEVEVKKPEKGGKK